MTAKTMPERLHAAYDWIDCAGEWDEDRIRELCIRFRRGHWSALEILSEDDVSAEDRIWACLHSSLLPDRVMARFVCEVSAEAMRRVGWADPRSWAALNARLAHERGEIGAGALHAAWSAAWSAANSEAWSKVWARQVVILRTLILLDLDGYDVLRGELGGRVPRKVS